MNMSPHIRTMTGLITVGIFGLVAASAWPTTPWLTALTGGLAIFRLVMVFRQWPSKQ